MSDQIVLHSVQLPLLILLYFSILGTVKRLEQLLIRKWSGREIRNRE